MKQMRMTTTARRRIAIGLAIVAILAACGRTPAHRTFATPEDAVRALAAAVKAGNVDQVVAIFGPEGQALIDSSDPATSRRNRRSRVLRGLAPGRPAPTIHDRRPSHS